MNPAGGKGEALKLLPQVVESFAPLGVRDIRQTTVPGQEEQLAREAIARKVDAIIAVGGDGTCSNIANAILRSGSACRLAVVPAGTGNDFAKTLGVSRCSVPDIAGLVSRNRPTSIDVGVADGRYFINSCGFGFDASVLERTARVKFLKGDALYIYAALTQLFTYRGSPVVVGSHLAGTRDNLLMVTVSNGRYLGGAFHIAPHASVLDGSLDVCLVRDASVLQRVRIFAAAFRGTHGALPSVTTMQRSELLLSFRSAPLMELDGELRQSRSEELRIECMPRALSVIAAPDVRL